MSRSTLGLPDHLARYLFDHGTPEPEVLAANRRTTGERGDANLQISPLQGQLLRLLVELSGARRALEVGTFTGYSSTAIALALPDDGSLLCVDNSEERTAVARQTWADAGVDHKIELALGQGTATLAQRIQDGEQGTYDLIFIDADKESYPTYVQQAEVLLRSGGLLLLDNALWSGRVADPEDDRETTRGIRAANRMLAEHSGFTVVILPVGDGLSLARRR